MSYFCNELHQLPIINFDENNKFSANFIGCEDFNIKNNDLKSKSSFLCGESKNLLNANRHWSNKILISRSSSKNLLTANSKQGQTVSSKNIKQSFSLYGVFSQEIKNKFCNVLKSKPKKKYYKKENNNDNKVDSKIHARFKKLRKPNATNDKKFDIIYKSSSKSSENTKSISKRKSYEPETLYHLFKYKNNNYLYEKHDDNHGKNNPCDIRTLCRRSRATNKYNFVCDCNEGMHYKLVDFPRRDGNNFDCSGLKSRLRHGVCKSMAVGPSCFSLCDKGAGDSTKQFEDVIHRINRSILCLRGVGDKMSFKQRHCGNKIRHTFKHYNFNHSYIVSLLKLFLKMFLLTFSMIVWAPCILLLSFYWIITYPFQPKHVLTQAKKDSCIKCESCFHNGHEFWHSIFHSIIRSLEKVLNAYNALCSSIRNQNHETMKMAPCLPQSTSVKRKPFNEHKKLQLHVNRKHMYTLYYKSRKGWMIRPFKKCCKGKVNGRRKLNNPFDVEIGNRSTCNTLNETPYFKLNNRLASKLRNDLSRMVTTEDSHIMFRNSAGYENARNLSDGYENNYVAPWIKTDKESHIPHFINSHKGQINCLKKCHNAQPLSICPISPVPSCSFETCIKRNRQRCSCSHIKNVSGLQYCHCRCKRKALTKPSNRKIHHHHRISFLKNKNDKNQIKCVTTCKKNLKRQSVYNWCNNILNRFKSTDYEAEFDVWDTKICNDIYMSTLRRKPWFWIHRRCPSFYPYFLIMYRYYENFAFCFLFIISTIFWLPLISWCYICYSIFCKCLC